MMLERIADDVWGHAQDFRLPGGMLLPSRSTILRLGDGGLVVHSPLAIDDAVAKDIDALGEVRFLVAPNCVHWMFLKAAAKRYPKARILAAPGLEKKLAGLPIEQLKVEQGRIDALGDDIRVERVEGAPYMNEHAFLHVPSRSLLVTDLIFNVHTCNSFGMTIFLRIVGAWRKTGQSRFWRFLVKNREAAGRSAATILGWDFERVVVAHGTVVVDDARERARQALSWMMHGAPPLLGTGSGAGAGAGAGADAGSGSGSVIA